MSFHERFKKFFQLKTKSVFAQAQQYSCGLMQATKKNIERMVEVVPDSNSQSVNNFITDSPWEAQEVTDQVAVDSNKLIGSHDDSCLGIDESGFSKKGEMSVGVARQWNGRLGKVDNCQVGVFASLGCHDKVCLVDTRLFLPECWTDDRERCLKAGVPEDRIKHRTKIDLALEMVTASQENGLAYKWISVDALYGNSPEFLRKLDQMGETFMADVHCDQVVYLQDPKPYVPQRKSTKGRKPKLFKTDQVGIRVDQLAKQAPESNWVETTVRESTKGKITAEFLHKNVWLWDGKEEHAHLWHLVIRRDKDSKSKYSLSNAPLETPIERLAFMQGQRYWIERAFQDGKGTAGMADYQVRGWTGWHHHMAMVMMTQLFMLETKMMPNIRHDHPLLSCRDIQSLLAHFLPRRDITKEEVLRQMHIRHRQRALAIKYCQNKRKT